MPVGGYGLAAVDNDDIADDDIAPGNALHGPVAQLIGRVGISLAVAIFCIMLFKAFFFGGLLQQNWLAVSQQVLHLFMISGAIAENPPLGIEERGGIGRDDLGEFGVGQGIVTHQPNRAGLVPR